MKYKEEHMDIKAKINELVEKIKNDPQILAEFKEEPVMVIEKLLGVDLPDDLIEKVVEGVKAKITADRLSEGLSAIKKLF